MEQQPTTEEQWKELIAKLTYRELNSIQTAVSERIKEMRDASIAELRAQAELLGIDAKDLVPRKTRKRRKKEDDDTSPAASS